MLQIFPSGKHTIKKSAIHGCVPFGKWSTVHVWFAFHIFLHVYWRVRPNIPVSSHSIFPLVVVIPINPNLFDILHKSPLYPHQKPCHFKDFTTSKAVHCLQHVAGLLPSAHHPFLSWERYVFINGVLTRNWVAEKNMWFIITFRAKFAISWNTRTIFGTNPISWFVDMFFISDMQF